MKYTDEQAIELLQQRSGIKYSDEQLKILRSRGGLQIVSCAGSGKTMSTVHLVAKRIMTGEIDNPKKLLMTTFSKSGADEMSARINALLESVGSTDKVEVKTMHASYYKCLAKFGLVKPLCSNAQRKQFIRKAIKDCKLKLEDADIDTVDTLISYQINNMMSDDALYKSYVYTVDLALADYANIRTGYAQLKKDNNLLDFDDLQYYMYYYLCVVKYKPFVDYCRSQWEYFYVDEFQDTAKIQFKILQELIQDSNKLVVIGDDDQCLVEGTRVCTETGTKNIEDVRVGDKVVAARGKGKTDYFKVNNVSWHKVDENIVKITTKSGKVVRGTVNHVGFAHLDIDHAYKYKSVVFVEYNEHVGYKLSLKYLDGHNQGETIRDLLDRVVRKNSSEIWIVGLYVSRSEGIKAYKNELKKYGLVDGEYTENLLYTIAENGTLYDYDDKENENVLELSLFNGNGTTDEHIAYNRLSAKTFDKKFAAIVNKYVPLKPFNDFDGYVGSVSRKDAVKLEYSVADIINECELHNIDLKVVKSASICGKIKYRFTNFGSIIPGMNVPVLEEDGKLVNDTVVSVERERYNNYVYDISVDGVENFSANSLIVHNCIYAWRGADPSIILNIGAYYSLQKCYLSTNYRCKANILHFAETGVVNMYDREEKKMLSYKPDGEVEFVNKHSDDLYEIARVTKEYIKKDIENGISADDIAVLVRNNAYGSVLSNMLMLEGIYVKGTEEMKLSKYPLFKDLEYLVALTGDEHNDDCYDSDIVGKLIWRMVLYMGVSGAQAIAELMDNKGLGVRDAIAVILRDFLCYGAKDFTKNINIDRAVRYKIDAKCRRFGYETRSSLNNLYEILKTDDREEKLRRLLYQYKNGMAFLLNDEDTSRIFRAFFKHIDDILSKKGITGLEQIINMTKQYESGRIEILGEKVTLTTVHSSKGLEWKHVIIMPYDNIAFPSFRNIMDLVDKGVSVDDIEKYLDGERRLNYVGLTRAIDKLTLIGDFSNFSLFGLEALGIIRKMETAEIIKLAEKYCKFQTFRYDLDFEESAEYIDKAGKVITLN